MSLCTGFVTGIVFFTAAVVVLYLLSSSFAAYNFTSVVASAVSKNKIDLYLIGAFNFAWIVVAIFLGVLFLVQLQRATQESAGELLLDTL
jgi:uncharacterized membrane protein